MFPKASTLPLCSITQINCPKHIKIIRILQKLAGFTIMQKNSAFKTTYRTAQK